MYINLFKVTADSPRISSLTLSSFWWPIHGTTAASAPPCCPFIKASCSLLNSPKMFYTSKNCYYFCFQLFHILSFTDSLIFAPALFTAEYRNDPNVFAPCVTFVVTKKKIKKFFIGIFEIKKKLFSLFSYYYFNTGLYENVS